MPDLTGNQKATAAGSVTVLLLILVLGWSTFWWCVFGIACIGLVSAAGYFAWAVYVDGSFDWSDARLSKSFACGLAATFCWWMMPNDNQIAVPADNATLGIASLESVPASTHVNPIRQPTIDYWGNLRTINQRVESLVESHGKPDTIEQQLQMLDSSTAAFSDAADQIDGLSTRNVDSELIEHAADLMSVLSEAKNVFGDLRRLLVDSNAYQEHANSTGAMVESFLGGLLGDPMAKTRQMQGAAGALSQQQQSVMGRMNRMIERGNQIDQRELVLRARLTRELDYDFEPLD